METRRDSSRLLWGILLVALGLLFLSSNFGYGTWFVWDRWWPLVLIAIGVIMLYRRSETAGRIEQSPPPAPSPAAPNEPPGSAPLSGPGQPPFGAPAAPGQAASAPPSAAHRRYPTGAIILIGVGVAFLLDNLVGGNAFPAFVLIAIGIALLLRQRVER